MKIKTLIRTWSGNLMHCYDTDGPEVELDEGDILFVEACTGSWVPDEHLTAYIYFKSDRKTLTVRYLDLKAVSEVLAQQVKESHKRKIEAPDPCRGSCT